MAGASDELKAQIASANTKPLEIASFLDGLTSSERISAIRSLGRSEQSRLWQRVDGFAPVQLKDIVPADRGPLEPVRHYGRNTLPLFTHFEKRFCKPDAAHADEAILYGYNFQTMSPITGPGYFVAYEDQNRPEVLVDYHKIPSAKPESWPGIQSNETGLSRFVYGFMVDTLRRVSEHVTIGSAARKGKDLGSWFMLCREA